MGIEHFVGQSDWIGRTVAILLLLMSLLSWGVIIRRLFGQLRQRRRVEQALAAFWSADDLETAVTAIRAKDRTGLFANMAEVVAHVADHHRHSVGIGAGVSMSEAITRALRNHITHCHAHLESGLTLLASIGSTAPFIGLFGTVWGIYHALVGLSEATQVVLGKVAGPVGEALIMTAAGLFVAIPAVLAYNALNRGNRLTLAYLDGFAHDLHAYLTTGARASLAKAA